jgi:hypothetical protein
MPAEAEEQVIARMQETKDRAKPDMSLLHHLAALLTATGVATQYDLTVRTADGSSVKGKFDHLFIDGLSLVVGNDKRYFPLTGITEIALHFPKGPAPLR